MPNRPRREDSPHRVASQRLSIALKASREAQGLSQQEVANRARVAIGTVRAIEAFRTVEPGYFTVLALAGTLGLNLEGLDASAPRTE